jgi:antitoxin YefM
MEPDMDTLTYSQTRQSFANVMDRVNDDRAPLLITRQQGKPVVMMSLGDFNAIEETAYLLRSPANAQRLIDAIAQLRSGGGSVQTLPLDADKFANLAWADYLFWQ